MASKKPVYILNGPNLNLLGTREPDVYGTTSLADIEQRARAKAQDYGHDVCFHQSNDEGALVNLVQEAGGKGCGLIINAGAYTHTSIALLDAVRALDIPVFEVHLSNIFAREAYRHKSYIAEAANGVICGLGVTGYILALTALLGDVEKRNG